MNHSVPAVIKGRYALIRGSEVEGGLSAVYKASDLWNNGLVVAVKLLGRGRGDADLIPLVFRREVASLRALDHPNIVRLLDAGQEETSGQYFIALEWLPRRLGEVVAPIRADGGWDDFATEVGLPILRALSYAHERGVVHRDIKPSNVLATERNIPKVVDFGISKLKTTLDDDPRTLAEFGSGPYTPLDRDSASSASRDLYGFTVLVLHSLTDVAIRDHSDISTALEELDAPPRVMALLKRCVADEPRDRPSSATVLLHELEAIQAERTSAWTVRPKVFVRLTNRAISMIQADGTSLPDADSAEAFIAEQLNGGCHGAVNDDGKLRLVGSHWDFIAADDQPPFFVIISALQRPGALLDRARETAAPLDFEFTSRPPTNYATAEDSLQHLRWAIEEHERERKERAAEAERFRLFDQWERQLRAREAFENRREPALAYEQVEIDGQRATFTLIEPPASDIIGQQRMIDREGGRGPRISGEVDLVRGLEVIMHLDRPARSDAPRHGRLVLDTTASRIALDRQLRALSGLRLGTTEMARNDLGELILDPARNRPSVPLEIDHWTRSDLDQEKRSAVAAALGAEDFYLVKGPPGTGKTGFIAELVAQEVRRNPRARILVASQTHVALDNAMVRVAGAIPSLRLIRLGRPGDEFLPEVRPLMLESQRDQWIAEVRFRSEEFIQNLARERGADLETMRAALLIGQIIAAREESRDAGTQISSISDQISRADDPDESIDAALTAEERDALAAQQSTLKDAQRLVDRRIKELSAMAASKLGAASSELEAFDTPGLRNLAADCFPVDTTDRAGLRDLVVLQGEWLDQVGHGRDFEEAFLASASVVGGTCIGIAGVRSAARLRFDVCVVDEATKATATEALVPLIKADRWVLVGDQKQLPPFQDEALRDDEIVAEFQLDSAELRRTLFDRLVENVDPSLIGFLGTQHRMTRGIGELISECFYQGELLSADDAPSSISKLVLGRPVTWITTEKRNDRRERPAGTGGLSFANACESAAVLRVLRGINERLAWVGEHSGEKPQEEPLRVMVLSGYLPQVADIARKLEPHRAALSRLSIEVNTVDASQGREAPVVVFSVVRSNPAGRLGFLEQSTRINVALSRAQQALVIIGDAEFCGSGDGPLAGVLSYVQRHPDDCQVEELDRWS